MKPKPICLSHPDCALCLDRQRDGRPSGWLPHLTPDVAQRLLGAEPDTEMEPG